jgi:hypothetical protein
MENLVGDPRTIMQGLKPVAQRPGGRSYDRVEGSRCVDRVNHRCTPINADQGLVSPFSSVSICGCRLKFTDRQSGRDAKVGHLAFHGYSGSS